MGGGGVLVVEHEDCEVCERLAGVVDLVMVAEGEDGAAEGGVGVMVRRQGRSGVGGRHSDGLSLARVGNWTRRRRRERERKSGMVSLLLPRPPPTVME